MTTGHNFFDKTIQTTNIWLNEIGESLGAERQMACHALKAVLHELRDRLPVAESAQFAAQLPMLVRSIYFDGWNPSKKPGKDRSREKFLERISGHFPNERSPDPELVCRAVFGVLNHRVSPDELDDVKKSLPKKIRSLWPDTKEVQATHSQNDDEKEKDMSNYDDNYNQSRRGYGQDYDEDRYGSGGGSGGRMNRGYGMSRDHDDGRFSTSSGSRGNMGGGRNQSSENYGGSYRGGGYGDYGSRSSNMNRGYSSGGYSSGNQDSSDRDRYYGDRARSMGYGGGSDYDRYSSSDRGSGMSGMGGTDRGEDMNRGYAGSDIYDYGRDDDRYSETNRSGGSRRMSGNRQSYGNEDNDLSRRY